MLKTTRDFISITFCADVVDHLDEVRDGMAYKKAENLQALREDFLGIIENREITPLEWSVLTDVDLETEDEIYAYLEACYHYLFEGAEDFPEAPR